MKLRLAFLAAGFFFASFAFAQNACDSVRVIPTVPIKWWSPDGSTFLVNKLDTDSVFQIYIGTKSDTTLKCISNTYTNGNCCGLFRDWSVRNKMQTVWHPSGKWIICAVEKEFYQELLYTPYNVRLGILETGIWTDIWAVTPDGQNWYNLATTIHGMTGPAWTPDGLHGAWAEALDTGNIFVEKFGVWRMRYSQFVDSSNVPLFKNTIDISPAGARWLEPGTFHPDGEQLLISSDIGLINAEGQDQFILNVRTGAVTNLTNSPMVWDEHGVWSPDGSKVLFMSSYPYRSDTNSYHTFSIKTEFMLMNPDGSGLQQLTHFCDSGYIESGGGIAAVGVFGDHDSTIHAISLLFPYYNYWLIKFNGDCGYAPTPVHEVTNNHDIYIYPNPVHDVLTIEAPDLGHSEITITNAFGQTVKEVAVTGPRATLKTGDLAEGIYFLRLKSGTQLSTGKFMKAE